MMKRMNISSGTPWEQQVCYSRAVRKGPFVFVSGTTSSGKAGTVVGRNDPYAQAKYIFQKIEKALGECGAEMSDVVRTRMFITNIGVWQEVCRAHAETFRDINPAATLVAVNALVNPDLLVEIEVDAVVAE